MSINGVTNGVFTWLGQLSWSYKNEWSWSKNRDDAVEKVISLIDYNKNMYFVDNFD